MKVLPRWNWRRPRTALQEERRKHNEDVGKLRTLEEMDDLQIRRASIEIYDFVMKKGQAVKRAISEVSND